MIIGLNDEDKEEMPAVDVCGIKGYPEHRLHFDVNGSWGGKRAIVAHFSPNKESSPMDALTYLYILVGPYWQVGEFRWKKTGVPTKWEIAKLVTEAMEDGADRTLLYKHIKLAISKCTNLDSKEDSAKDLKMRKELPTEYLDYGKDGCASCIDDDFYCNECVNKIVNALNDESRPTPVPGDYACQHKYLTQVGAWMICNKCNEQVKLA